MQMNTVRKLTHGFEKTARCLFVGYLLLFAVFATAQTVPSKMKIGDVELKINENARRQIQKDVDRLTQSETYYNILVDRMNLYFPFIEREHRKGGVPDEIKFLAIQESALISDAVSSANAVGFWQFKDFTGREVGLRVDRQVDERLNIVSSSRGSAKYFNSNNFFFDNWPYAVIAYQAGAGGAKAHTDKKNYGGKKLTITVNSYWYLKKFIAHVVAFTPAVGRPHSEGIWLDEVTNAGGKSLYQIARAENVDLEELKKYNKWLKIGSVPKDKTYAVLVPRKGPIPKRALASNKKTKPEKIAESSEKKYPKEVSTTSTLPDGSTVIPVNDIPAMLAKESDDLHSISARAGLSVKAFKKYNDLTADQAIVPNSFYFIRKKKGWSKVEYHTVQEGETLWGISQKYGIRLLSLAKKNGIASASELKPGRVLWLKKKRPKKEPVKYEKIEKPTIKPASEKKVVVRQEVTPDDPVTAKVVEEAAPTDDIAPIVVPVVDSSAERKKVMIHTVAKGETLTAIARLYDMKMEDLLRWNELPNPNAIHIGQNIRVKEPIEEASEGKNIQIHVVQPKETLYGISRKYSMTVDEVMELNNMKNFDLDVGQELKVFESDSQ